MIKLLVIFILSLSLTSCDNKNSPAQIPSISVRGLTDFGSVLLGDQIDSVVVLDNRDGSSASAVNFKLDTPFYIISYQPNTCSIFSVPSGTICNFKIRFSPSVVGQFKAGIEFKQNFASIFGAGIRPGEISVSTTNFQVGTVLAGSTSSYSVQFTNTGNSDVLYPTFISPEELVVSSTTCPGIIRPSGQCLITIQFTPVRTNQTYAGLLQIQTQGSPVQLLFQGKVGPGPSDGNIRFKLNPEVTELTVASPSVPPLPVKVTTLPITDHFGNLVEDGTVVSVNVFDLSLAEDPVNHLSARLFTKDGVVSFNITAGEQTGSANFSAQTETSYGTFSINIKN
jgi:hypothetical protein